MHRRLLAAAMASALSVSVAGSAFAAPPSLFGHASDSAKAGKMISFNVRNSSGATLVLKAGDQQITIEPGKTSALKLAEGVQVTTVNSTATQAAGAVLTTVSRQLAGNTLVIS